MRLTTLTLSALTLGLQVAQVSADVLTILTRKGVTGSSDSSNAMWETISNVYSFNANEGCRNPGVPNINRVCMDWGNKRGHFNTIFGEKRCVKEWNSHNLGTCRGAVGGTCHVQRWREVACTW
ncbi:hypothetical protein V8F06_014749 [Rhypophila decipiens]